MKVAKGKNRAFLLNGENQMKLFFLDRENILLFMEQSSKLRRFIDKNRGIIEMITCTRTLRARL